jgi:hypothetical protein
MRGSAISRRRFVVAAVAFSGMAQALKVATAWAQQGLAGVDRTALAQMARRLYPHDAIGDDVYAEVADGALTAAAGDASLAAALAEAGAALDAASGGNFTALGAAAQTDALRALEDRPFFAAIQAAVLVRVYNHPAVWDLVGYGGPSFEQGGYLNRGAGVVGDWLEENG